VEVLLLLLLKSIHAAVQYYCSTSIDGETDFNVVDSTVASQQAKLAMQSKTEQEPGQNDLDRLRVVKSLPMQVKGKRYHRQVQTGSDEHDHRQVHSQIAPAGAGSQARNGSDEHNHRQAQVAQAGVGRRGQAAQAGRH
jgi:hypothetical protein